MTTQSATEVTMVKGVLVHAMNTVLGRICVTTYMVLVTWAVIRVTRNLYAHRVRHNVMLDQATPKP